MRETESQRDKYRQKETFGERPTNTEKERGSERDKDRKKIIDVTYRRELNSEMRIRCREAKENHF